jgi:hypothetical protein
MDFLFAQYTSNLQPSNAVLYTVRTSTTLATRASDGVLEYVSKSTYMPTVAINPLQTANAYMHTVQQGAEKVFVMSVLRR